MDGISLIKCYKHQVFAVQKVIPWLNVYKQQADGSKDGI
jgi:hypothetical protein